MYYRGGMYGVDHGSVDNRSGVDQWGRSVVDGGVMADDALGRHSRGMVKRKNASVDSGQHGAQGYDL